MLARLGAFCRTDDYFKPRRGRLRKRSESSRLEVQTETGERNYQILLTFWQLPIRKCELCYSNAFTPLVAIVLSAQSTDKGVNRATAEVFKVADRRKTAALGIENWKEYIKTIGLYNNKAKSIIAMRRNADSRF